MFDKVKRGMESSDLVPDRNTAMTDRRFPPLWDIEESQSKLLHPFGITTGRR